MSDTAGRAIMTTRPFPAPDREYLSKKDVADLLDVSERTLERMIAASEFPRGVRWGVVRKWRATDVTWWLLGRDVQDRLGPDPDGSTPDEEGEEPAVSAKGRK